MAGMDAQDFDVDRFLARPLTARLATVGPRVRPVWYLWEAGSFWIMTGPWTTVPADVAEDGNVAIAVDTCDILTGECLQVIARGHGRVVPYDVAQGRRKLERYLGADELRWDGRFRRYLSQEPQAMWLNVTPASLVARDLSFTPSSSLLG